MSAASLSVIVPAYNEESRLPALLDRLECDMDRLLAGTSLRLAEVIVVDDGSNDATAAVVGAHDELGGRLSLLRLDRNRGKGAAVRAGMRAATGERALVVDADMSTPLDDVVPLSRALDDGCDLAIGSRSIPGSRVLVHQPRYRELMGKTFNVLLRLLTGVPWRDTQCGFKLFSVEPTRPLFDLQCIDGFAFDAELCVNARRLGLSVAEVPVRWVNHPDTRVTLVRSSLRMLLDLFRIARCARRPLTAAPRVDVADPAVVAARNSARLEPPAVE
jgi:dolichyl-phosphate beta-glucosyltransferase